MKLVFLWDIELIDNYFSAVLKKIYFLFFHYVSLSVSLGMSTMSVLKTR